MNDSKEQENFLQSLAIEEAIENLCMQITHACHENSCTRVMR
jgi:hypothetical protein